MRLVDASGAAIYLNQTACEQIKMMPTVDPVHAAGGCYCRECRMRTGVETKETVLCGYHGCSMRKDDFCSMGKREENNGDG